MKIEENKVNGVETRVMAIETRVNMMVNCKDRTRIVIREKGIIKRPKIHASRHPRRVTLRTRLAGNVGNITSGNADRGIQCVTSAVRRGTLLEDVLPRPQIITSRTGIKDHNSNPYKL